MMAYTKPQQRKKEESERQIGGRDQIQFIDLRIGLVLPEYYLYFVFFENFMKPLPHFLHPSADRSNPFMRGLIVASKKSVYPQLSAFFVSFKKQSDFKLSLKRAISGQMDVLFLWE